MFQESIPRQCSTVVKPSNRGSTPFCSVCACCSTNCFAPNYLSSSPSRPVNGGLPPRGPPCEGRWPRYRRECARPCDRESEWCGDTVNRRRYAGTRARRVIPCAENKAGERGEGKEEGRKCVPSLGNRFDVVEPKWRRGQGGAPGGVKTRQDASERLSSNNAGPSGKGASRKEPGIDSGVVRRRDEVTADRNRE